MPVLGLECSAMGQNSAKWELRTGVTVLTVPARCREMAMTGNQNMTRGSAFDVLPTAPR